MDKLDPNLCAQLAKGIIGCAGCKLDHTIGHESLSTTVFLHSGKRCIGSLKFKEQVLVVTIKDQVYTYDYANPDSFDPDVIGKMLRDQVALENAKSGPDHF